MVLAIEEDVLKATIINHGLNGVLPALQLEIASNASYNTLPQLVHKVEIGLLHLYIKEQSLHQTKILSTQFGTQLLTHGMVHKQSLKATIGLLHH